MKMRFAVIGFPLKHTMSPFIHKRMFALNNIDAEYEAILTPPEKLTETVALLKNYKGFNITIPHKESLLGLVDEPSPSALTYGAVNTVKNKNGKLIGYSTDAEGFSAALELENIPISGRVLILGCGGVSRTIATECINRGCEVTLAARKQSMHKAFALSEDLKNRFNKNTTCIAIEDICEGYDLAVNGTPVGMYPKTNDSVLNKNQLKNIKYLFDSVYNPENTALVSLAKSLGVKAISGMGMLVMQAAKAQEYWLGVTFKKEDIKNLITDANEEMRRIFSE